MKDVLGEVVLKLSTDDKEFLKGLSTAEKRAKKADKNISSLSGTVKKAGLAFGAAAAAIYGVVRVVGDLIDSYGRYEKAVAKVQSALRSTGNAVGISKKEMLDFADAMQRVTTYSNTAVIEAQGIMATFTEIGRDVFPQAVKSAMDMSTMFGQDLKQSVIQLGTALNDPIRGVGRLRRIGVSFTEQQKEMIKTLVESGDKLGAQKVILAELRREFGGVAEEVGKTATGAFKQLGNAIDDLKRTSGEYVANGLKPIAQWLTEVIEKTAKRIEQENELRGVIRAHGKRGRGNVGISYAGIKDYGVESTKEWVARWQNNLKTLGITSDNAKEKIQKLTQDQITFTKVLTDLQVKLDHINELQKIFGDSYDGVAKKSEALKAAIKDLVDNGFTAQGAGIQSLLKWYGDLIDKTEELKQKTGELGDKLTQGNVFQNAGMFVNRGANLAGAGNVPTAGSFMGTVMHGRGGMMTPHAGSAIETPSALQNIMAPIMGIFQRFGGGLMNLIRSLSSLKAILDPMSTILSGIMEILGPVINKVLAPLQGILLIIGNVLGKMIAPVLEALTPVIEFIGKAFVWLYNKAIMPFANIVIKAGNMFYNFIASLVNFFIGMLNGVIKMLNNVLGWAGVNIGLIGSVGKKNINTGMLEAISYSDLVAKGEAAQAEGYGGTGNIQQARPINIKVYIQDNNLVGSDGFRELALILKDEFASLGVLGL